MVRGLYTAYTGLVNQQNRLDVITNNLANASTSGYKKEGATSQSFDAMYSIKVKDSSEAYINRTIGRESLGVKVGETYTDFSQGSLKSTSAPYDLALAGDGFFTLSFTSKNGVTSTRYTRDGSFTTTQDGTLVTKDGDYVLGQGGQITIPTEASDIKIDEMGNIYANGEYVDTLLISDFEDYNYLKHYGENMWTAVDGATEKNAQGFQIKQGYLEMSNMNVVSEMVDMITISRAYESAQKVVQTIDTSLGTAVNLGKMK